MHRRKMLCWWLWKQQCLLFPCTNHSILKSVHRIYSPNLTQISKLPYPSSVSNSIWDLLQVQYYLLHAMYTYYTTMYTRFACFVQTLSLFCFHLRGNVLSKDSHLHSQSHNIMFKYILTTRYYHTTSTYVQTSKALNNPFHMLHVPTDAFILATHM